MDFDWWVILSEVILWAFWALSGALIFGLYYLLYKRTLKKKGSITSASFVVRAPLIIGCINLVAFVCLFSGFLPLKSSTFLYNFFSIYYFLTIVPLSIGSIAISFLEYKRKLISSKRFAVVFLINIICLILFLMLYYWFWRIFANTCNEDFCGALGG